MLNGVSHFGLLFFFVFVLADYASLNGDKSLCLIKKSDLKDFLFFFWLIERDLRVECHLGGLQKDDFSFQVWIDKVFFPTQRSRSQIGSPIHSWYHQEWFSFNFSKRSQRHSKPDANYGLLHCMFALVERNISIIKQISRNVNINRDRFHSFKYRFKNSETYLLTRQNGNKSSLCNCDRFKFRDFYRAYLNIFRTRKQNTTRKEFQGEKKGE